MPIYEYKCLGCEARVEKMQKVSDAPLERCEACGGRLEKQVSLSGFQFKGAGWYVTDYAAKGGAAGTTAEKSDKDGKTDKSDAAEKSSPAESTAATESASKNTKETTNDAATVSKTETTAKKE